MFKGGGGGRSCLGHIRINAVFLEKCKCTISNSFVTTLVVDNICRFSNGVKHNSLFQLGIYTHK